MGFRRREKERGESWRVETAGIASGDAKDKGKVQKRDWPDFGGGQSRSELRLLRSIVQRPASLATIPVELAAIAVDVAVLVAQFPALVPLVSVVAVVQVATQLAAIMSDVGLVVPDIAVQTSVPIPGKRRRHTHSH
jgi:hypothetical protein